MVQILELVADLIKNGQLKLEKPINKTVTYHDPCRLNKRKGIHEAPRFILNSIPGLVFKDVDHVTQWSYCLGGGHYRSRSPKSPRRSATPAWPGQGLDVEMLVSACVWSGEPLATAGHRAGIEVADIIELVAESAGIEIGGRRGASDLEAAR